MDYMLHLRPAQSSRRTEQAGRVLRWLTMQMPAIRERLPETERQEWTTRFARARLRTGAREQAPMQMLGRQRITGTMAPVSGSGDDAYGHIRLEAVINEVIIPLIERDAISAGQYHQLYQRLRGEFSHLCQKLQRAWWVYTERKRREVEETEY